MKRNVWRGGALAVLGLLLAGCTGGPHFGDAQGWSSSQKKEFEQILREDRYVSICGGMRATYSQYLRTRDTKLLSKLLVDYTRNLANSCIDLPAFDAAQKARRERKIHTRYKYYLQSASASQTLAALRDGKSIEQILHPYIPPMPQFHRLVRAYHSAAGGPQGHKLRMSIERAKLMKPDPEAWRTYFLVNIPEFKVRFFEDGNLAFVMKTVVGQKSWQTPIFSASMKYVVLNPTWNVPDNIARAEEIPHLLRDRNYLKRKRMVVLRSYDIDSTPVDPRTINWRKYLRPEWKKKELPYKLIQLPAKGNALGRVKFMFPNPYSVYMHDTPMKSLFKRDYRAYSHGCIRLDKPMEMLEYLARRGYLSKDWESVKAELATWKLKTVSLSRPIPVHVGYFTAYPLESGGIGYFPDIYGYDKIMRLKSAE
ncbi:L,D-transpeptidase family protein [Nitratifractor sp.]